MRPLRWLALLLLVTGALVGCSGESETTPSTAASRLVGPSEFARAVAEPDRVTVNVHVPFEGDIPGTDASIPYDEVRALAERLPPPGTPLAVYCRSGSMSAEAAPVLQSLGYVDIVELRGGMEAWTAAGRRLD